MSMRSVASATISVGLVSIPVKAYLSASPDRVSFNWLTPEGHRVKQKCVDAETGVEIQRSEIVSGYEISKDEFIQFTDEELNLVSGEKNNVIEVHQFSSNVNLSPLHVERVLFLGPDKSDRAYRLLSHCLGKTNKVAVCKWYVRGKDHLVVLSSSPQQVLLMHQMYYQSELRELGMNFAAGSEPGEQEVKLGTQLIKSLSGVFDLAAYRDEYLERLTNAITVKQQGKKLTAHSVEKHLDTLLASLQKSLGTGSKK